MKTNLISNQDQPSNLPHQTQIKPETKKNEQESYPNENKPRQHPNSKDKKKQKHYRTQNKQQHKHDQLNIKATTNYSCNDHNHNHMDHNQPTNQPIHINHSTGLCQPTNERTAPNQPINNWQARTKKNNNFLLTPREKRGRLLSRSLLPPPPERSNSPQEWTVERRSPNASRTWPHPDG